MSKRPKPGSGGDPAVPTKKSRSDLDPESRRGKSAAAKLTFPATPEYFMQTLLNNHGKSLGHRVKWTGGSVHLF